MHSCVVGNGVYMRIYVCIVHIPNNLKPVVIWIDYYSYTVCV